MRTLLFIAAGVLVVKKLPAIAAGAATAVRHVSERFDAVYGEAVYRAARAREQWVDEQAERAHAKSQPVPAGDSNEAR